MGGIFCSLVVVESGKEIPYGKGNDCRALNNIKRKNPLFPYLLKEKPPDFFTGK
jgi:hypothetical protein